MLRGTGKDRRLDARNADDDDTEFFFSASSTLQSPKRTVLRVAGAAAGLDAARGRAVAEARSMKARACIFGAEEAGAGG